MTMIAGTGSKSKDTSQLRRATPHLRRLPSIFFRHRCSDFEFLHGIAVPVAAVEEKLTALIFVARADLPPAARYEDFRLLLVVVVVVVLLLLLLAPFRGIREAVLTAQVIRHALLPRRRWAQLVTDEGSQ